MATPPALPGASLPAPLTAFVGREREAGAVRALLGEARLLTLTGAAGSGKTRLALAVAGAVREEQHLEVGWIELAALDEPAALPAQVALALGARTEGGGTPEQAIAARLRERPFLLALDNCEHLVEACATLVRRLLDDCPRLHVLATSREALGVAGERSWLVPALALPPAGDPLTPDAALGFGAVRLFVDRARDVLPGFQLTDANLDAVRQVCHRLDGLPLALELAAARVTVLPLPQLAARLDDRFALLTGGPRTALPRHRTLRAAVDWSYELLGEPERLLLERLSVFAGGFTLDAAEAVCAGDGIPAAQLLDLLAALTTRSLVAMQEDDGLARYRLLETIREYAAERRRARGEGETLAERHARYYLALAQAAEPALILGRADRLRQVDVEHDNLRAALAWSAAGGHGTTLGLPLGWALLWYWFHRQLWREGYAQLDAALASAVVPPDRLRAAALHGLGLFGLYAARPESRARLEEADRLWRQAGELRWLAFTLLVRTTEASLRRDAADAHRLAVESVAVARAMGGAWEVALTQAHALVPSRLWAREWAEADALLGEAERVYREYRYHIGVAYVLDARAFTAFMVGQPARAVELAQASLREEPGGQNRWLAGRSLRTLGAVAAQQGDLARAVRLFGAADGMYEAIGARALTEERQPVNALPAALRERLPAAEFAQMWEAGRALPFHAAVALALEGGAAADPAEPSAPPEEPAGRAPLEVRALGPLEIRREGQLLPAEAWPYALPRELFLYFLAHPEGRTREQVGLDFWPDVAAAQVKNNFHVALHHLRKALGASEWIRFDRGRYRVATGAGLRYDAAEFEAEVAAAGRALRAHPGAADALTVLSGALTLYRGPYLEGERVGDWHLEVRAGLARRHEEALLTLAAHAGALGRHAEAAEALRRLLAADPLHEVAAKQLMLALASDQRRSDALRVYERLRENLRRELGVEPSAEVSAVAERLRRG